MRIGYAPGRCLRAWLMQLGYSLPALQQAGVVTADGFDTFAHRIVFPLDGNLYGRSISASATSSVSAGRQGRLVWLGAGSITVRKSILVEGLFDYAVLVAGGFS